MGASIEQLKNDIDTTIQEATNLLEKGTLYLETKGYTYVSEGIPTSDLEDSLIKFIFICRTVDQTKAKLEKLKTEITEGNINDPDALRMNLSQDLHTLEEPTMHKAESTMGQEEPWDEDADWAAEADEEIAQGKLKAQMDVNDFLKLVDVKPDEKKPKSANNEYRDLANLIQKVKLNFDQYKQESTRTFVNKETAQTMVDKENDFILPDNTDNDDLTETLSRLKENFNELEESKQKEQPQKPTSAAMKYLQKRQAEAPDQKPVSNTPTAPFLDSKKRKRDQ